MPSNYKLEVLARPPLIQPPRTFIFPQRLDEIERGALHVMVTLLREPPCGATNAPETPEAAQWLGIFALGYDSPHVVTATFETASPDHFIAISGGYAYVADIKHPEKTVRIRPEPVVFAQSCDAAEVLVCADFRTIFAISPAGLAWQTDPLSSEGLTDIRIDGDLISGAGWDAVTDRETAWRILACGDRYQRLL